MIPPSDRESRLMVDLHRLVAAAEQQGRTHLAMTLLAVLERLEALEAELLLTKAGAWAHGCDPLLTSAETQQILRVSGRTVRRYCQRGVLHAQRLATGGVRIPLVDVQRLCRPFADTLRIDGQSVHPTSCEGSPSK
jgi:hypothetical protein